MNILKRPIRTAKYSDQELIELATSEVGDRKKAIAEEILRRRHQQRLEKGFGPRAAIAPGECFRNRTCHTSALV